MQYDTTLTRNELDRIVDTIEPTWGITSASPAVAGHHIVYQLGIETPAGRQQVYLKATPEGKEPTVDLEARLLAVLSTHSSIPVPSVWGVVDEHDALPAPFAVVEALPGESKSRTELAALSDTTVEQIARDTGRILAELHAIDVVDSFGFLSRSGPALLGEQPSGEIDSITVADPVDAWHDRVHAWADETLEQLETTQFADVAPRVEPVLRTRIDALDGRFEPVLSRIDQSLENVLLESGRVTALLDWEFTIAATPAYDLASVAWSLAGGQYLFAPGVPDRRESVRRALLEGYRDGGSAAAIDQFHEHRACYDLLSSLRSMVHLEDWFRADDLGDRIDPAARKLREEVMGRL